MKPEQVVIERNTLQHVMDVLMNVGGHTSPIPQLEEDIYRLRDNEREYTLRNVEDHDKERFYNAQPTQGIPGRISYFLDTNQRTQLIGHFITPLGFQVPIHYCIISSIILERQERKFKVWGAPRLKHLVLLPSAFLEDRSSVDSAHREIEVVDTEISTSDYTQIRVQSIQIAHRELTKMKIELLSEWFEATKGDGDYLIHNGSTLEDENGKLSPRVIGLSKTVYLPFKGAKEAGVKHLELSSFQRTSVFKLFRDDDDGATTKYAWFIKLREHTRHGPEFGLIKPVIIAGSDGEAVEKAEWMTFVLLKERQPATFPAKGWDKLIFPIKLCRTYLDGIVPTHETIRSFFDRA
ncbi:hypothetical protein J7K50_04030 [bacterium]|nr:hypothetical protein [bacterium]